jgi:hypothetical protein
MMTLQMMVVIATESRVHLKQADQFRGNDLEVVLYLGAGSFESTFD